MMGEAGAGRGDMTLRLHELLPSFLMLQCQKYLENRNAEE